MYKDRTLQHRDPADIEGFVKKEEPGLEIIDETEEALLAKSKELEAEERVVIRHEDIGEIPFQA